MQCVYRSSFLGGAAMCLRKKILSEVIFLIGNMTSIRALKIVNYCIFSTIMCTEKSSILLKAHSSP